MDTLKAKLFIAGKIELLTGLHIGGSSSALDIGGIDANVIKTPEGIPYIPGSSLKGKMRCLLERKRGFEKLCDDKEGDNKDIPLIFGLPGNEAIEGFIPRLLVRDAYLNQEDFEKKRDQLFAELELPYSESKWENTIDRATGATTKGGLRQMERVPAGATFDFAMVYSIFNDTDLQNLRTVIQALRLLEDDYLGGSGSRGYGQIRFSDVSFSLKTPHTYESDNSRIPVTTWPSFHQAADELLQQIQSHLPAEGSHAAH